MRLRGDHILLKKRLTKAHQEKLSKIKHGIYQRTDYTQPIGQFQKSKQMCNLRIRNGEEEGRKRKRLLIK